MTRNKTQIFGDGESVTFLLDDFSDGQVAYIIKNPNLMQVEYNCENHLENVHLLGDLTVEMQKPRLMTFNFELRQEAKDVIIQSGKNLFMNLDLFKNISVSKMFQIINKKLKKRENDYKTNEPDGSRGHTD